MAASYRISAAPLLHTQGDFNGKLKGVSFTAVSPTDTREWFANNCGQFELVFSKIMPRNLAQVIVASLMHGDDVELPGLYDEWQFERGFLFEWTPVYLVTPQPYARESFS
ncbi:MAG TPA: hypothetical protein VGN01_11435 [Acidobacteriaceae bacterium]|jgi:hypothetical protein